MSGPRSTAESASFCVNQLQLMHCATADQNRHASRTREIGQTAQLLDHSLGRTSGPQWSAVQQISAPEFRSLFNRGLEGGSRDQQLRGPLRTSGPDLEFGATDDHRGPLRTTRTESSSAQLAGGLQ